MGNIKYVSRVLVLASINFLMDDGSLGVATEEVWLDVPGGILGTGEDSAEAGMEQLDIEYILSHTFYAGDSSATVFARELKDWEVDSDYVAY